MADGVFDVIVIGAGVEGSATAYQLMKIEGEKKIALVEQVLRTSVGSSNTVNDLITRPSLCCVLVPSSPLHIFCLWHIGPKLVRNMTLYSHFLV